MERDDLKPKLVRDVSMIVFKNTQLTTDSQDETLTSSPEEFNKFDER